MRSILWYTRKKAASYLISLRHAIWVSISMFGLGLGCLGWYLYLIHHKSSEINKKKIRYGAVHKWCHTKPNLSDTVNGRLQIKWSLVIYFYNFRIIPFRKNKFWLLDVYAQPIIIFQQHGRKINFKNFSQIHVDI